MSVAFTQQIDIPQLLIVAFFFGLVYYIRGEDKRECYPLEEPIPSASHGSSASGACTDDVQAAGEWQRDAA